MAYIQKCGEGGRGGSELTWGSCKHPTQRLIVALIALLCSRFIQTRSLTLKPLSDLTPPNSSLQP